MSETPWTPPYDGDAERALIASVLGDNSKILDIAATITAETFYNPGNKAIWKAVIDLYLNENKVADPLTVCDWLASRGQMQEVGGYGYYLDLVRSYSNPASVEHYAEIIRGHAIRRELHHAGGQICLVANDRRIEAVDAAEKAEQIVFGIINKQQRGEVVHMGVATREAAERIEKRATRTMTDDGVLMGIDPVDGILGAMENGAMIVIAARPGSGKTAFVMNVAKRVAARGEHVLFSSMEMSRIEIGERFISMESGIDGLRLKRGQLNLHERERVGNAAAAMNGFSWSIDDTPHQTVMQIAAAARREKMSKGLKLVVIDYMQLISVSADDERSQRHEQVAKISRRLKILARELNVPVIVLAQVNRKSEDRVGGRIKVSDLRESGAVEQDADVVMLLQTTDQEKSHDDTVEIDVEIGKNRNGATGVAKLMFHKYVSRFDKR
jgi:replicative DNA helicase